MGLIHILLPTFNTWTKARNCDIPSGNLIGQSKTANMIWHTDSHVQLLSCYLCFVSSKRPDCILPSFLGEWGCQRLSRLEASWQEWFHSRESSPVQSAMEWDCTMQSQLAGQWWGWWRNMYSHTRWWPQSLSSCSGWGSLDELAWREENTNTLHVAVYTVVIPYNRKFSRGPNFCDFATHDQNTQK